MGYVGFSKSENAVSAENMDKYPVSVLAKKLGNGITTAGIKAVLKPCEWHHTSKMYNCTDYYDMDEAIDNLDAIKKASNNLKVSETAEYKNVKVEWLEWSGSRNHPHATKKTAENCTVQDMGGCFVNILFQNGSVMKKKKDAKGLKFGLDFKYMYDFEYFVKGMNL